MYMRCLLDNITQLSLNHYGSCYWLSVRLLMNVLVVGGGSELIGLRHYLQARLNTLVVGGVEVVTAAGQPSYCTLLHKPIFPQTINTNQELKGSASNVYK